MNVNMQRNEFFGSFKKFSEMHDAEWETLTREEKDRWKENAKRLQNSTIYRYRYLPLERRLKKFYNDEDRVKKLIQQRVKVINDMIIFLDC